MTAPAQPKRMGRPPMPPEQRKLLPVRSIRLTDAEWTELQRRGIRGKPGSLADWLTQK